MCCKKLSTSWTTAGLTGVSLGGEGNLKSSRGSNPADEVAGAGKTEVEIDILLYLGGGRGGGGCWFSEAAAASGLATSSLLTKSFTEEFLCLRLARVATPRLKLFSRNLASAANSKAEDWRLKNDQNEKFL